MLFFGAGVERPFLRPLHRFLTLHPREAVRRVIFILRDISGQIQKQTDVLPESTLRREISVLVSVAGSLLEAPMVK